jgi:hypothetical protein
LEGEGETKKKQDYAANITTETSTDEWFYRWCSVEFLSVSFVVSRPEVFHEGVFISHSIRPHESIQNPRVDTNFREKSNAKFILVDNLRLGNLVVFTLK